MTAETTPSTGHNSGIAGDKLKSYVARIFALDAEKRARAEDIKDIFIEVKAAGFDTKTVRALIRRQKMDAADREEQDALLKSYERVFG